MRNSVLIGQETVSLSVLRGLNEKKMLGLSPGTKKTVRNNKAGVRQVGLDRICMPCLNPVARRNCPVVGAAIEMRNYMVWHSHSKHIKGLTNTSWGP